MKKKKQRKNLVFKIIAGIYSALFIVFMGILLYLNIVPDKYMLPLFVTTVIISILLVFLTIKKNIKTKIKWICVVFMCLLSIIYGVGTYYMYTTINFLGKLDNVTKQVEKYYVVVNNESDYKDENDLKNEEITVLNKKNDLDNEALDKLKKELFVTYNEVENLNDIESSLKDNEPIFVSSSLYNILCESMYEIDEYSEILYTIEVSKKVNKIENKKDVTNESFNIYISGADSSGTINSMARSDVNMVVTINPKTHKILLTSIPRDYYVTLHSFGAKDKLTHAGIYGINESVSTVEDLLGIEINYYAHVNFTTLINIVDVIGGIDVYSDYTFTTHGMGVKYTFYTGNNTLNGQKALAFARERKSFVDGDKQRVKNQQKVLSAILNKVANSTTILTNYSDLLNAVGSSFQTNMSQSEITALVKKQLNDMPSWTIENISLDGSGSNNVTYTYGNQLLYVMVPDGDSVYAAQTKIKEVMN